MIKFDKQSKIIEVKQGPYTSDLDKKRFSTHPTVLLYYNKADII